MSVAMTVQLGRLGRQVVMLNGYDERLIEPMDIIGEAARRCGVSYEEVMSRSREAYIVEARHEAILALARLGYPPQQIAREMRMDHTTVLYHLKRLGGKHYERRLRRFD